MDSNHGESHCSVAYITTAHEKSFPLTEQLMALILVVQGEMTPHERERFDDKKEGEKIENWTRGKVMQMYHKLFVNAATAFENPHHTGVTHGGQPRSFYILDEGEIDGSSGYWAIDESDDTE